MYLDQSSSSQVRGFGVNGGRDIDTRVVLVSLLIVLISLAVYMCQY